MSDSDTDCDCEGCEDDSYDDIEHSDPPFTITKLQTSDLVFEHWGRISVADRKKAGHLMKVCAFWLPILLQRNEANSVFCWAAQVGLVEPNKDVTLRHIHKIEILEAILRALVEGSLHKAQTKQVVFISNCFTLHSPEVLENALQWLERTGEPNIRPRVLELGHLDICFDALQLIFAEYARYVKALAFNFDQTMRYLTARPSETLIKRSEDMKKKGNEYFQRRLYEEAVKFYTKAIRDYPDNHIIYGNRALCYIKSNNFIKALGDGKRATLIKPLWAKGHYRYCEALFGLGEMRRALEANSSAQIQCKQDPEGIKDLEMQHHKFTAHISDCARNAHLKRNLSQKPNPVKEASAPPSGKAEKNAPVSLNGKVDQKAAAPPNGYGNGAKKSVAAPIAKAEKKAAQAPSAVDKKTAAPSIGTEKKPPAPHDAGAYLKAAAPVGEKKEPVENLKKKTQVVDHSRSHATPQTPPPDTKPAKSGNPLTQGKAETTTRGQSKSPQREQKRQTGKISIELSTAVRDGHTALDDLRSRNAEEAFSRALALMGPGTSTKVLGVSSIDVLLLQYGRATALTQIGRPEELSEAVQLLDQMQRSEERTFQCLVCLAYGRVYVKENRYSTALTHFSDALQMVKNKITPGKLTWPLTTHLVPETQVDFLMDLLQDSIELCKFPLLPDAVCRLENCIGSAKKEIYFTDPDFKGFIQIHCCQSCRVEYHMNCWKSLKSLAFYEKSEKDFLQDLCLTPDCTGQINTIKIYGPTGLVKCKFEVAIPKPVTPKKLKVNQKCTSLKKIKSKEERLLRRKRYKQPEECEGVSSESALQCQDSANSPPRARLHFRDHVLLQISQHMELLRQEKSPCVAILFHRLRPWLQLDWSRGSSVAARLIQCLEEPAVSLGAAVELLLERRNRVWARIFIHSLSDSVELQPRVSSWAHHLDSAGLSAAQCFIERHSKELEQLDLSLVLHFLEKLDSKPEVPSSLGLRLIEYLRQSPAQDMRLFIWALEEHRQSYTSCHSILDHYFDMMDGLCSVLKKSEVNIISSPSKSKHRSRKKKGQKPVLVWPISHAEEWDPGLQEEDSLMFTEQPFTVPFHLRQQLASFEEQYRTNSPTNHVLDSPPQLSKDTLYEYFTQILEEHGPLVADDPLLVGEVKNFPVLAQQQIFEAGGLEAFLLGSPAFTRLGAYVGLSNTEGQQNSLDQLDVIDSDTGPLHQSTFFTYLRETFPTLPSPYVFDLYTDSGVVEPTSPQAASSSSTLTEAEGEPDQRLVQESRSSSGDGTLETLLCVAVNTEVIQEYERSQGELNSVLKLQQDIQRQMSSMCEERKRQRLQRAEELRALQEELDQGVSCVQVTQQELALFQHKLEEEVKKDQKDKREHQEQLRALKQEEEGLKHEHQRLKRSIRDKKSAHETRLQDFLQFSNQCATERMSLEDEIKRCKDTVTRASRRSLAAQLRALKSSQEQSLYPLHRELCDNKAVLWRLDDVAPRFPPQDLEATQNSIRDGVQDIEKKIASTEAHYNKLMEELKSGSQLCDLQPVSEALSMESQPVQVPEAASLLLPQPPAEGGASPLKRKKRKKAQELLSTTVFERAVESLGLIFPDISRSELTGLIQRFRWSTGSLQNLGLQDVVGGVSQLILDQQEERSRSTAKGAPGACAAPPLGSTASAWQPQEPHRAPHMAPHTNALNSEDPCIICHDDMSEEDMCVLDCRHSFHKECIRSWLKEQNTCPTCREHTLMPEDFPALSSKRHI
ncbi:E3 ubiquitin-protein ligase TTC3 [Eucyclogobius newberryi]|uniref:E3 ubiquitin-protein ligase TTC3 n=1 Tax=Eucyclogobius newberryi TaxID=166745 RepID=UPI003B5B4761